ncbi:MAG: helix-turn-helix domain-containing protein [Phycisphaerales bacterium]
MNIAGTALSVQAALERRKQAAFTLFGPEAAAIAIADLDPHALNDLRVYVDDLRKAREQNSAEAMRYVLDAIAELFGRADMTKAMATDEVLAKVVGSAAGATAVQLQNAHRLAFRAKYFELKSLSGLATIKAVADATGLSPTTVQAIEDEANTAVPQFRTLQRLAAGFNKHLPRGKHVTAGDLRGC